jgi:integrase
VEGLGPGDEAPLEGVGVQPGVRRYLSDRPVRSYLFSPAEAEAERRARVHAERKTPLSCGNAPGTNRKEEPKRKPGDHYDVASYRRAIARACEQAFPPPEHLLPRLLEGGKREPRSEYRKRLTKQEKSELARWRREHTWHPHQLRHNAATYIRREFGIEAARVILGHRSLDVTEIYAEADHQKVQDVIRKIG